MRFWGVQVKWGEKVDVDPSDWPTEQLHLSQATLWQEAEEARRIGVKVTVYRIDEAVEDKRSEEEIEEDEAMEEDEEEDEDEDEDEDDDDAEDGGAKKATKKKDELEEDDIATEEVLICSLKKETQESTPLDLVMSEPFSLELVCQGHAGELDEDSLAVHLSGYFMPGAELEEPRHMHFDDEDEEGEEEEEDEEEDEDEDEEEEKTQGAKAKGLQSQLARKALQRKRDQARRGGLGFGDEFEFGDDDEDEDDSEFDDGDEDEEEEGSGDEELGDFVARSSQAVFANSSLTSVRIVEVTDGESAAIAAEQVSVNVNGNGDALMPPIIEEPESPLKAGADARHKNIFGSGKEGEGDDKETATPGGVKEEGGKEGAKERPGIRGGGEGRAGQAKEKAGSTPASEKKKLKKKKTPEKGIQANGTAEEKAEVDGGVPVPGAKEGTPKSGTPSQQQEKKKGQDKKQHKEQQGAKAQQKEQGQLAKEQGQVAKEQSPSEKPGAKIGQGKSPKPTKHQQQQQQESKKEPKAKGEDDSATPLPAGKGKKGAKGAQGTPGSMEPSTGTPKATQDTPKSASASKKVGSKRSNEEVAGASPSSGEKAKEGGEEKEKEKEKKRKVKRSFPNGFEIEELALGNPQGKMAKPGKTVFVRYTGKLKKSGKVFDSNVTHKSPFKTRLGVGEVIKGWDLGLEGMRVGDKRRLTIPPPLGYGHAGSPPQIPPSAWLLFDVELVDVK